MKVKFENSFDWFKNDEKSRVFQVYPECFKDNRGYFLEVAKNLNYWPNNEVPLWFATIDWIRQINRSASNGGVIRGCHAQKGSCCQGKLVEAINEKIYDIITDVRPDSKTFCISEIFILDPEIHNRLWIPRGFLHSFVVPFNIKNPAIFEYQCDNVYNHEAEIGVNPSTLLPNVIDKFHDLMGENEKYNDLYDIFSEDKTNVYSEKDMKAQSYMDFINEIKSDYEKTNKQWYK